jgi:hypothetical protein
MQHIRVRRAVSTQQRTTLIFHHLPFCLLPLLLQAVVFGVSCYFDVQDMMEKRVRSRFSNRKVFLNGLCAAQQVSGAYWF